MPLELGVLRVDGGATRNDFLMQFQADVLRSPSRCARERETTALGAAALALGVTPEPQPGARFEPRLAKENVERLYAGWREALHKTMTKSRT